MTTVGEEGGCVVKSLDPASSSTPVGEAVSVGEAVDLVLRYIYRCNDHLWSWEQQTSHQVCVICGACDGSCEPFVNQPRERRGEKGVL